MPLPSWIRCLICLAFLFSSIPREPAFTTQTIDQHCLPFSNEAGLFRCSCSDKKGRKYNLASLANNDGHPRFTVQAKDKYFYSYNPCKSFKLGKFGDCSGGNVAICRWTNTSYENIGHQRTEKCCLQSNGTPSLQYQGKQPWLSIVYLQCDPKRKSIQSAEFSVIEDAKPNPVRFLLKHYCACPNACADKKPTPRHTTAPENSLKKVGVPIFIAAGALLFLGVSCIAVFRLLGRRENRPQEERPLINGQGEQTEETSDGDFFTPPSTLSSV
ncbi:uncharacterized protein LOC141883560 [Acropora palmata]|uniref:uncharacterized protein LOC141883560 n=1 Tax=Acropora palmata TaxID=6131 RepID=UPI003D9FFEC4